MRIKESISVFDDWNIYQTPLLVLAVTGQDVTLSVSLIIHTKRKQMNKWTQIQSKTPVGGFFSFCKREQSDMNTVGVNKRPCLRADLMDAVLWCQAALQLWYERVSGTELTVNLWSGSDQQGLPHKTPQCGADGWVVTGGEQMDETLEDHSDGQRYVWQNVIRWAGKGKSWSDHWMWRIEDKSSSKGKVKVI